MLQPGWEKDMLTQKDRLAKFTDTVLQVFEEKWSQQISEGQVISICWEEISGRIAVGTHDNLAQVWSIDSNDNILPIFNVRIPTTVPAFVTFTGKEDCNVYVFGMYNGQWYVIECRCWILT